MVEPDRVVMTVAAFGPAFGYPTLNAFDGDPLADQGSEVPYGSRRTVEIEAAEDTPLGDVIDEAAARFDVRPADGRLMSDAINGVVFYLPGDEGGFVHRPEPWPRSLRLPNESGAASWPVHWAEVRVGELVAAGDAGLLDGDPLRPYLWPCIPQGDTQTFLEALWTLWLMWEHVLAVADTRGVARVVLDRIRRGRDGVQHDDSEQSWRRKIGRPHELIPWLDEEPRSSEQVASMLRTTTERAEGVLWGMGYLQDPDDLWRPAGDGASRLLRSSLAEIERLGRSPDLVQIEMTWRATRDE